jgi:hypothetical protein
MNTNARELLSLSMLFHKYGDVFGVRIFSAASCAEAMSESSRACRKAAASCRIPKGDGISRLYL